MTTITLRNAFNRETFIFSGGLDNPDPAMDVVLEEGGSGGGNALVHVHPGAAETFVVRSGRLRIVIDGKETFVDAGGTATVPKGRPHYFTNAHTGTTQATVSFEPPQRHVHFFIDFATLTEKRPQWFSPRGDPKLLLIAAFLHRYKGHLYLAGPPVFVQKLLFALLAPIARLMGYRVDRESLNA